MEDWFSKCYLFESSTDSDSSNKVYNNNNNNNNNNNHSNNIVNNCIVTNNVGQLVKIVLILVIFPINEGVNTHMTTKSFRVIKSKNVILGGLVLDKGHYSDGINRLAGPIPLKEEDHNFFQIIKVHNNYDSLEKVQFNTKEMKQKSLKEFLLKRKRQSTDINSHFYKIKPYPPFINNLVEYISNDPPMMFMLFDSVNSSIESANISKGFIFKNTILQNCYHKGTFEGKIELNKHYINPDSCQFNGDSTVQSDHCYLSIISYKIKFNIIELNKHYINPDSCQFNGDSTVQSDHCYLSSTGKDGII
ncbi:hypothetical protein H8356DRAFT_1345649 [Neocallimastix lanati (nom. inval.)]|nr:hypothetical protein H8356DRAFT_1345649 [Neocallimastix sp. JGI-2020a]